MSAFGTVYDEVSLALDPELTILQKPMIYKLVSTAVVLVG